MHKATAARANEWKRRPVGLEHDPEKWIPVFGKRSCSKHDLERDDDSKKSHLALRGRLNPRRARLQRADAIRQTALAVAVLRPSGARLAIGPGGRARTGVGQERVDGGAGP